MAIGKSERIIGIDLGTTNSCVAVLEGEWVRILENDDAGTGKGRITPSVVSFDKDAIPHNVGEQAKTDVMDSNVSVIYEFKRLIGRRFDDEAVQRDIKNLTYSIIRADNGDAWVDINGKPKSPLEVSSQVLRKLRDVAEKKLGESVKSAVITVPAYFDNSQRQATKEAGRIVGLCVRRIINEPTAAALAYLRRKVPRDSKIAIYDIGGGTFDISIIETSETDGKHQINVMSINGDTHLGGKDFDDRIIDYICEEFKKEHGMDPRDRDDLALGTEQLPSIRLKEAAERAKIILSNKKDTNIHIPFIAFDEGGPKHLKMNLTRAKLESLVEDLIARTLDSCQIAMQDAGISASDIDDVILVGGQTRMPKVREAVESIFDKEPRQDIDVNVDEAVAIGAAIQGGILTGDIDDLVIYDCTPLSLGIRTKGGVMTKVIEKNTKIPIKILKTFETIKDNQQSVTISIFQGERQQAEDNTLLDQFDFDIPPAPRREPIEVTFDIDDDGILSVSIMHEATGRKEQKTIAGRSGLSKKQIDQAIRDAEKYAEEDSRFRELADARNDADSEIYNARKLLSRLVYPVEQSKKIAIDRLISDLEDAMEDNDATQIKFRKMILEKECRKFCELADARNDEGMIPDGTAKIPDEFGNPREQSEIVTGYQNEISPRSDSAKEFDNIGTDPNGEDKDGWTPLHESAWNGCSEKIKKLIKAGFDPNATNKHGHTPLHLAAFNGFLSVTRELIDAGSDPNAKDEKGNTPLHNTIASRNFAKIEAMINSGSDKISSDSKIAIYDLSGGTFDISIIEISKTDGKHQINVISINGNTHLGGEDFDNRIIDYLCEEFKKEHAMDLRDSDGPFTLIRLREAAECAKIILSNKKDTNIHIPFIAFDEGGSKHLKMNLTRAKLESLVEDMIARTLDSCQIAMQDAGVSASDIDDVILVGGQTRMPKVREAVELIFGKEPKQGINVDGMIALRTEIQRGILIYIAAFYGYFGTIKALVKAGANIDEALPDGTKPYDIAADQGYGDAIIAAVAAAKGTYIGTY